ncbi:uncharacterized protein DUF397 [Stackebrandtia endophytica]|uniref:Uncharacterized protein DUF397 n=1 Tax=Stackebrandtia endophytica TaxID=1496996 RepID=A0A543ARZ1_9ACTN|nr:DUF397 domain-containing protein [Stackebrandtia endophytica]TQL75351.1 uncharacterized protein DUF397 [Stackebrandtia endophytica]
MNILDGLSADQVTWQKSRRSNPSGNCVEIATGQHQHLDVIADSKETGVPDRGVLQGAAALIHSIRFDLL